MYGEIYESGKVGEIHIDPFSYTYTGNNEYVQDLLESWEDSGLNFYRAEFEDGENSTYPLEDKERIWNNIEQQLIMVDSSLTIVDTDG